jgi:receptor protein-tyrosine kinase
MNDQTPDPDKASGSDRNKKNATLDALDAVPDAEVHAALVLLHRLSNESVERINALMSSLQIRFSEAALETGVITQQDLDEALSWIRQRAHSQGRSLVEDMMRRRTEQREVVLWKGDALHAGRQLIIAHDPDHPRSELMRRLRTELLLRTGARRGAAFFAVLSPSAREGRSQLAAELAISFAQLGRKTLLVDADLRRPTQHDLFSAANETGLAQALAADGPLNMNGVQGLAKLAVLTSGGQPPNPVELLHGPRFNRMIAEWRRNFEFVVLDTPPTSEFSDGLTIASSCGSAILLGRAKVTTFSALKEMRRHLEPTNTRIVGAVINSF